MAILCWMPTIQYLAWSGPLSVHKLFTSCIRRCLVSRACDWVMSALSAVLLIFSFQFRSAFLSCRSAEPHSGALGLPNIGHRSLPKIWVGFLYGAYSQEEWFLIDSNGKMETGMCVFGDWRTCIFTNADLTSTRRANLIGMWVTTA